MTSALSPFPHSFGASLLLFSVALFWNVGCSFISLCLAESWNPQTTALIIVRVQNDYMKNGTVEVQDAESIIPVINALREENDFKAILVVKESHGLNHTSFTDSGDTKGEPVHCILGTLGEENPSNLKTADSDLKILMGQDDFDTTKSALCSVDDNGFITHYDPVSVLGKLNIDTVVVVGIDVQHTAIDAVNKFLMKAIVIKDACRYSCVDAEQMANRLKKFRVIVTDYEHFTVKVESDDTPTFMAMRA